MAPRTRKHAPDPEDSIHPTPRQAKASPIRSHSARAPRTRVARYRQSTLTQIVPEVSFLSRGSAAEESEDEEQPPRPVKRRRRRIGPSQKTLTQIGWINPLVMPSDTEEEGEDGDGDEADNGFESEVLPSDDDEYDEVVGEERNADGEEDEDAEEMFYGFSDDGEQLQEDNETLEGLNASPQTPRRLRPREIPSSQTPPVTPLTPLSVLRKRARYNQRSPLKAISTNRDRELYNQKQDRARMPPPKLLTPVKGHGVGVAFDTNVVEFTSKLRSERSNVSESQDLNDKEINWAVSPRGKAIGQETQAMIHQIDAACVPNGATPEVESRSPSPSQSNRSFNFDEQNDACAGPSPAPAAKSPILDEEIQENDQEDEQELQVEQAASDEKNDESSASSFPTPRAPPPTQAIPSHMPTQESRASQPFAVRHPSQVSTVAETTQATSPPREKGRSQKRQRGQHQRGNSDRSAKGSSHETGDSSQLSRMDDSIHSQASKGQHQHRSQQHQVVRIPESPVGSTCSASSHTKTSERDDQRQHSRQTPRCSSPTHSPTHAPSSFPQPPTPFLLTSSPIAPSPFVSAGQRRENVPETRRQRQDVWYNSGAGDDAAAVMFDGNVVSATQMLPESLMEYSLPLPPAGWDASSVVDEDEGEDG